jgi:hypothetical protein
VNPSTIEPVPLSRHRVLSTVQCRELATRVLTLRDKWIPREGFFSLGTAAYLDANGSYAHYLESARKTNRVLRENFADTYDMLRAFFGDILFEQVNITDDLAVPGFHIFEFNGHKHGLESPSGRAHFDLQWMHAFPSRELTRKISFTLAVQQPTGGAGLEVWPLRYCQAFQLTSPVSEYARTHSSRRLAYTDGSILVHDGDILHAIGNSQIPNPCGQRITLQGHGALLDGSWVLYW